MNENNLKWTEGKKTELLKTPVFSVDSIHSTSPDKKIEGEYIVINSRDWVCVIPEVDEDFLMVRQWRHGERAVSIEFPGGVIDDGETPEQGALRELREETGCRTDNLIYLGKVNPNPAIMSNHMHFFLARNLEPTGIQDLDDDEYVEYLKIPKKEVFEKMGSDEYPHALMTAALLKYIQWQNKQ